MRKILKCILAVALLSMVFTSNVFADGSITASNMNPTSEDTSVTLSSTDFSSHTVSAIDTAIKKVNTKAGSSATNIGNLDSTTVSNLNLTSFSSRANITPFVDITASGLIPSGGVNVTVKLNSSILSGASSIYALHIKNDATGTVELLPATKVGTDSVKFTATSFSPFAFVIDYPASSGSVGGSSPSSSKPVVNTAANEVNHTNHMAYTVTIAVLAVGTIVIANKKLRKNVK